MEFNNTNNEDQNPDVVLTEVNTKNQPSSDIQNVIRMILVFISRSKIILKKYLWFFLIIFIVGIGKSIYDIMNKEVSYQANLIFILQEENTSNRNASVADPLSSYLLTRVTSQNINLEKMREISFSQKLLSNLLFNKCIINGKENYLINHLLLFYYNSDKSFFKSYRGLNGLNRNQYRVFNNVSGIIRNSIVISQTKSGAFQVKIVMKNEELTKVTTELFYQNLNNFYIDKTTEKAQANYIFLRNRLDSVRNMLYSSEYQVANFEDRAKNLLLNTAKVPQIRQKRNTEFYQNLYGNLITSFENAKVSLNNITPIFQLLQRPYYPLVVITKSSNSILFMTMLVYVAVIIVVFILLYLIEFLWPQYKHLFKLNKDFN